MTHLETDIGTEIVTVVNPSAASSVVLVCEHASCFIPDEFNDLGLSEAARKSHVAWDPGAMSVARDLSKLLDAKLIAASVSRLVYDCNRPPEASDAMPATSEVFDIPGNADLSDQARQDRVTRFYAPFKTVLSDAIKTTPTPVIVTIHSFTPVYYGQPREVEIGVLHDTDARLADAMLSLSGDHAQATVKRNQPYGPENGVTHTLRAHAIPAGRLNVMLEIRNDLIATQTQQSAMAEMLAGWIAAAFATLQVEGDVQCQA